MRVFNIYRFNIADKVKFKDAQSYIQNMLSELGLGWSDLAFAASTVSGDRTISNVLEKLPKLKKYFKSADVEHTKRNKGRPIIRQIMQIKETLP